MNDLPHHLHLNEKEAIATVVTMLFQTLNNNLVDLYLFGSKSRGDFHADSDIDLLVIVNKLDPASRWQVRATAADCSLQYDVLFNTHIIDKARWDHLAQHQDTLWREVQRDGISLYDLATQPAP
jgi:predicted nucleotidyltransferase